MAILVLQHWETGRPGRVGATFRDHGFKLDIRQPHLSAMRGGKPIPADLDDVDGILILGGPQNVTDVAQYDWMQAEAEMIRAAHARALPIIGICLGAQLIAHALGGTVAARESGPAVGFFATGITPAGQTEPVLAGMGWRHPQFFSCGQEIKAAPTGATVLSSTKEVPVQAFRAGLRTYGFIFHFECDKPMLRELAEGSAEEIAAMGDGFSLERVNADIETNYERYARLSDRLAVNLTTYLFPLYHERRVLTA